jgi:hypothetical protein
MTKWLSTLSVPRQNQQSFLGVVMVRVTVMVLLSRCCYTVVTVFSHYCYTIVALLPHYRHTILTRLLHCGVPVRHQRVCLAWLPLGVTAVHLGLTETPPILRWCQNSVTVVLQWCYSGVPVVFQWCYSGFPVGF